MFDFYDDSNLETLRKISAVVALPERIEAFVVDGQGRMMKLAARCYADPAHRKFPVHTPEDAFLSRLYFTHSQGMYKDAAYVPMIADRLRQACSDWNLPEEYEVKQLPMAKTAHPVCRVPIRDASGNQIDEWTLASPRDFEKAAIAIYENKAGFAYRQRSDIARTMLGSELAKSAELPEVLSEYLEKAAGFGMSTKDTLLREIGGRACAYVKSAPEFAERMGKAAEVVASSDVTPDLIGKVAEMFDACDRAAGLDKWYDKNGFKSPEEALFQYTERGLLSKKASEVRLTSGDVVPAHLVKEATVDAFFRSYFGEEPEGGLTEKIAVLQSLPAPDAKAFKHFVDAAREE